MTKQQGYHKTRYNEYKNRNWLTLEYIKTRNTRYGEIKFGSVADAADALDEAQRQDMSDPQLEPEYKDRRFEPVDQWWERGEECPH